MLTKISIENFRSIEDQRIDVAPITVLYGATSSGKSSMMYALSILRNFILNANQASDTFFALGSFLNLGGYEACVFNHEVKREIVIRADLDMQGTPGHFGIKLGKAAAEISQGIPNLDLKCTVGLPYALNQNWQYQYKGSNGDFNINWNGLSCSAVPLTPTAQSQAEATEIAVRVNSVVESIRAIDICPHRRGFFRPSYNPVQVPPTPTSEDEIATLIINDYQLASKISIDLDEIAGRDFRLHIPPGSATAFLQVTEKKSRTPIYLVNDGFGVNQIVYMLAKLYRPEVQTLLIEEPEIHLHPTILRKFAKRLCMAVKEDDKQCIFATHSEQFILSLLTCVAEGIISPKDIRCHYVSKDKRVTTYSNQEISSTGQITGGLASFVEVELEDVKRFISAVK